MTCRTLEDFYHINGHLFEKQHKEELSGLRQWEQLDHAEEWLLSEEGTGPHLAIAESSLSNGELYTFVTNRDAGTRRQSPVAVGPAQSRKMSSLCRKESTGIDAAS